MKQEKTNSRRNFLSALAILSSGTVLAGSPLAMFEKTDAGGASLKSKWALFINKYGAGSFLNIAGSAVSHNMQAVNGHTHTFGEIVRFTEQRLLAQPTWIHWRGNKRRPDDVVIHFYEDAYPYKKIKSINRFELLALIQLQEQENLLQAICIKNKETNTNRLEVKTRIAKRKTVQEVNFFANNNIVLKQQFFYNV